MLCDKGCGFLPKGVLVLMLALCGSYSQAANDTDILLTMDNVKELVAEKKIILVDARPFVDFKKSHIQGAVSLPTNETFSKGDRSDLVASISEIGKLMTDAGISEKSEVVVYGKKNGFRDIARLFWVLETFGVKKLFIMNDTFSAWLKQSNPIESGDALVKKVAAYPKLNEKNLASMLMVFASITNEAESLVDARSKDEYNGQKSKTAVYGHIPSAINVPWDKNLTKDRTGFRPIDELKELYKKVSIKKMNTVYCNTGKKSAVSYVALRLINANVRAYDGSWHEWSQHSGLPVTKKSH